MYCSHAGLSSQPRWVFRQPGADARSLAHAGSEAQKKCQRNQRIPLAPDGEHVLAVPAVCAKAHILQRGLLVADANAADRTTFDFTAFEVELQVAEHAILRGRILGHQKLSHARANFGIQCQ